MTVEPSVDEYDLYALGLSEGEELERIRKHLAERCEVCVPAIHESIRFAAGMSAMVPQVDPPARLRRRVVGMVDRTDGASAFGWPVWVVLGAALGALFAAGVFWQRAKVPAPDGRNDATALLSASDMRQLAVHNEGSGRVDIFSSESRGVLLVAARFPPAPDRKTYEMWTIAKNAAPVPAGVFQVRADGTAVHQSGAAVKSLAAVALSVEPEGGSDHPTTKPFLVAAVP